MSNALFLIYFSIVNGVESLGEVYRGTRSPQGQWGQRCVGDRWRVPCWALRPSSGTLSVRAPLQRDCLWGSPWDQTPPGDRAPFVLLKDADLMARTWGTADG